MSNERRDPPGQTHGRALTSGVPAAEEHLRWLRDRSGPVAASSSCRYPANSSRARNGWRRCAGSTISARRWCVGGGGSMNGTGRTPGATGHTARSLRTRKPASSHWDIAHLVDASDSEAHLVTTPVLKRHGGVERRKVKPARQVYGHRHVRRGVGPAVADSELAGEFLVHLRALRRDRNLPTGSQAVRRSAACDGWRRNPLQCALARRRAVWRGASGRSACAGWKRTAHSSRVPVHEPPLLLSGSSVWLQ